MVAKPDRGGIFWPLNDSTLHYFHELKNSRFVLRIPRANHDGHDGRAEPNRLWRHGAQGVDCMLMALIRLKQKRKRFRL